METISPTGASAAQESEKPPSGAHINNSTVSPADVRSGKKSTQDRQSNRIAVTGWAHIHDGRPESVAVRVNELSISGFSIFLDFQLRFSGDYSLQLSIFRHGKSYIFDVQAHCIYATLVSGKGFRHGFEFSSLNKIAKLALREILG
jgi:hypothetical protein